ncbi:MAG: RES family NAD+ phosphorylase [Bacteroidetes bacterium]|nr:RES family NAD+ phosphorylase [Bacteroidota bacterium]
MKVYRLSKSKYATDLSGKGAELSGGRWNSKGIPMLYTAESRALCMVEVAVHLPLNIVPADYQIITLNIPGSVEVKIIMESDLPTNWNLLAYGPATQQIGDDFIKEGKCAILKVPSAIVKGDFNFLVNPHHKNSELIKIDSVADFMFDQRLFSR